MSSSHSSSQDPTQNDRILSPSRAPNANRSPRKTPKSQQRPTNRPRTIDDDIMKNSNDLRDSGNIDDGALLDMDFARLFADETTQAVETDGMVDNIDNKIVHTLQVAECNPQPINQPLNPPSITHPQLIEQHQVQGYAPDSINQPFSQQNQSRPHAPVGVAPVPEEMAITDVPIDQIPKQYHTSGQGEVKFILTRAISIPPRGRVPVGYKHPPTHDEENAITLEKGNIRYKSYSKRYGGTPLNEICRGFDSKGKKRVEDLITYSCGTVGCESKLKVARYYGYILFYRNVDTSGQVVQHQNHQSTKEEQKQLRRIQNGLPPLDESKKSRYSSTTLTDAQIEFIKEKCMHLVSQNEYRSVVSVMVQSPECQLTKEQLSNPDELAERIRKLVSNGKTRGDVHFTNLVSKPDLTGDQCEEILNALKTSVDDRPEVPPISQLPFLSIDDFQKLWDRIEVVSHDYTAEGNNFTNILFKYNNADALAASAAKMFTDGGVKLEMDFLVGVSKGDEWQFGHIGFSDLKHKYWILGMIISRSENNKAAGKLLRLALNLLQNNGGKGNRVLVDGGRALCKAIKNENEVRMLVEEVELELQKCLAHALRGDGQRGGGFRGAQGSVHRALAEKKVSKKDISKIIPLLIMMGFISPGDTVSFRVATDLLFAEFGHCLSDNFRKEYLNGTPARLGGLCAGRPGEVASTQGCERRGGYIKNDMKDKRKTLNVLSMMLAAAKDGSRGTTNNTHLVATVPDRSKVKGEYDLLRRISKFKCPDPNETGWERKNVKNFTSDFLYCLCKVNTTDTEGNIIESEVPLHSVLGKEGQEFNIAIPSLSLVYTQLKLTLLAETEYTGSPMFMQTEAITVDGVREMLSTPTKCNQMLTSLESGLTASLKKRIHNCMRANTASPRESESCEMYLRRRARRDPSSGARFTFGGNSKMPTKRKGRKSSKTAHQEMLEKEKWGGSDKNNGNKNETKLFEDIDEEEIWDNAEAEEIESTILSELNCESGESEGVEGSIHTRFQFSKEEIEREICRMNTEHATDGKRVRVLRELGDDTTVCVTKESKDMHCNCEMFTRWRICRHVTWMEVLHFGEFPPGNMSLAEDGWGDIRTKILSHIKKTHINVGK